MTPIERQQLVEETLSEIANSVEGAINEIFGKMGFALLIFDLKKPGIGNYVSNAERADMITALRETANRLENNESIPKAHTTIQ
jgi:hypothetical protein